MTTTTWGWPWVVVVTVRFTTRFTGRATVRFTTRFFATVTCFTTRGCWMRSVTYTPPPPITAPPQVQAHSFAKAMRTDIVPTLPVAGVPLPTGPSAASRHSMQEKCKTNY